MSRPPYKLLSVLLQYPDERLLGAREELAQAIESLPRSSERTALERFWAWFGTQDEWSLRRAYVETFDLQKRSSLYLTFYKEGDTRKRGQALLRLKRLYAAAGLELEPGELPDYLPAMLEFAEHAPADAGRRVLAEHRRALEVLRLHLEELDSPYRHLVDAVSAALPRMAQVDLQAVAELIARGPASELVGLEPFAPPEVVPSEPRR